MMGVELEYKWVIDQRIGVDAVVAAVQKAAGFAEGVWETVYDQSANQEDCCWAVGQMLIRVRINPVRRELTFKSPLSGTDRHEVNIRLGTKVVARTLLHIFTTTLGEPIRIRKGRVHVLRAPNGVEWSCSEVPGIGIVLEAEVTERVMAPLLEDAKDIVRATRLPARSEALSLYELLRIL
jgi:hypothetical protein